MIKVTISIKEQKNIKTKNLLTIPCEVEIETIGNGASENEHKALNFIMSKLETDEHVQLVNNSRLSKEELLQEIVNILSE